MTRAARSTVYARKVAAALYAPDGAIPDKPARKKAVDREGPIHRAIKRWLETVLPPDCFVSHIPGAPRNEIAGARLKALGATAGTPDIIIIVPGAHLEHDVDSRTFFLEVKAHGGRLSPEQVETIGRLEKAGAYVDLVRSVEEARYSLRRWGVYTREVG